MEIKINEVNTKKLQNINIVLPSNQITTLIGSNESIKTDLINLICGLEKIENGFIKYGRKKLDINTKKDKLSEIRKDIYYLKEDSSNMLFNITIRKDIIHYLGKYDESKLINTFRDFDLDISILNKNFIELSNSEYRIVLLIIGLISDYKILVLDNLTLGLDKKTKQTLIKYLKRAKRDDKIIVISSYDSNFLLEISDNVFVLDDKNIIESGSKYDVFSNEKLLGKINFDVPDVIKFINKAKEIKNIKLGYRDDINDLIKDIFRYAK